MKLDKFDLKILRVLQADGRQPAAKLGEAIGLTPSPTWERVRKLEQSGIVRGYHADIAIEQLSQFTHIIVSVMLASHRTQDFRRFEEAVAGIPEIVECWAVGGETDYVLRFVCAGSGTWQEAIERALQGDLGIERYWTYVVTKTFKPFAGMPLDRLMSDTPDGGIAVAGDDAGTPGR